MQAEFERPSQSSEDPSRLLPPSDGEEDEGSGIGSGRIRRRGGRSSPPPLPPSDSTLVLCFLIGEEIPGGGENENDEYVRGGELRSQSSWPPPSPTPSTPLPPAMEEEEFAGCMTPWSGLTEWTIIALLFASSRPPLFSASASDGPEEDGHDEGASSKNAPTPGMLFVEWRSWWSPPPRGLIDQKNMVGVL